MTIDEAIAHAEEQAAIKPGCECSNQHKQLAEWLRDYKRLRKCRFDYRFRMGKVDGDWAVFDTALPTPISFYEKAENALVDCRKLNDDMPQPGTFEQIMRELINHPAMVENDWYIDHIGKACTLRTASLSSIHIFRNGAYRYQIEDGKPLLLSDDESDAVESACRKIRSANEEGGTR